MGRSVTVTEAARILGLSRKTIDRRIKAGALTATMAGHKRIVDLPEADIAETEQDSAGTAARVRELEALLRVAESERDYLRQHVSELTMTMYRLTEQKALPATTETRPTWWQFWKREG